MRCGAQPAISTPSSSTRPLVGGTSLITARAVVVLPTPLRPGTDIIILGDDRAGMQYGNLVGEAEDHLHVVLH